VIRTVDEVCARALLDGLASGQEPRALPVLAEAARVHAALAPQAVMLSVRCGPSTDLRLDGEFTAWMLGELPRARHEFARGLLQAIGALDDGDAVPTLIERLEQEDAGLRDAALGALRRMTGLGFPATAELWRAWYAKELRWQERERPRLLAALQEPDPGRVTAALREYGGRRIWRGSLSQDVTRVLERREAGLRRLACEVLAQLGSPSALPVLSKALQDADAAVAEAAWQAMRSLSGMDLPRDSDRVREILRVD
jgi:HEAT repeat protein